MGTLLTFVGRTKNIQRRKLKIEFFAFALSCSSFIVEIISPGFMINHHAKISLQIPSKFIMEPKVIEIKKNDHWMIMHLVKNAK